MTACIIEANKALLQSGELFCVYIDVFPQYESCKEVCFKSRMFPWAIKSHVPGVKDFMSLGFQKYFSFISIITERQKILVLNKCLSLYTVRDSSTEFSQHKNIWFT